MSRDRSTLTHLCEVRLIEYPLSPAPVPVSFKVVVLGLKINIPMRRSTVTTVGITSTRPPLYIIYVGLASVGSDTVKHAAHYVSYNQGIHRFFYWRPVVAGDRGIGQLHRVENLYFAQGDNVYQSRTR